MSGDLINMTEEDWLARLNRIGVNLQAFMKYREELKKQFGFDPPLRDVVWRALVMRTGEERAKEDYRRVEYEKAFLLAVEGKDIQNLYSTPMEYYLFHDELAECRKLRAAGELDVVTRLTLAAVPTPAVLGELRKTVSAKARIAKESGNWQEVVDLLEGYTELAEARKEKCIELVNQAPPEHTKRDLKLLETARENIRVEN